MVVLTLFGKRNGETLFFDNAIPKVHFAKLISCSLYNSWNTLHKEGTISIADDSQKKGRNVMKFFPGHYDLCEFGRRFESFSRKNDYGFKNEENNPRGMLVIRNENKKFVNIDTYLANLFTGGIREIFGNKKETRDIFFFNKSPSYPTTYFVHCDLIDKEKNLFNGKKSSILARFDVKGKPYEKVTYLSSPQEVFRECSTGEEVTSITISVRDHNGELFDFKGLHMEFELELN